jgi:polyhydroxyalkanoate synthesis regulator phasin
MEHPRTGYPTLGDLLLGALASPGTAVEAIEAPIRRVADEMVAAGEIPREEADRLMEEAFSRLRSQRDALSSLVAGPLLAVGELLRRGLDLPTRGDMETLHETLGSTAARIEGLERALEKPATARRSPRGARTPEA